MDLLLGEHGEALFYGIVGTIVVIVLCTICGNNWKKISPTYKNTVNKSNEKFIENSKGKYPVIEADEIIYADYKNKNFDYRDHISAKDCTGKDITESLNIYGTVNIFQKGLYKLRCVVVAENQLASTKYVNVIVE